VTIRLGLDASLRIPSCAISAFGEVTLATAVEGPVEGFSGVVREVLRKAGLQLGDVDEFVACVGPGSYMGVRTAVTTANALALAVGRQVTGVLSVDAVAVTAPAGAASTVAVPAGRDRWFVADYRWSGEVLHRDGRVELVDRVRADAWRVGELGSETTARPGPSAHGALMVADRQRHLATETGRPEVAPHLPPPRVGGGR
jgi:tRNA threonylcarbamoyl adenosine modification protein YeaZ